MSIAAIAAPLILIGALVLGLSINIMIWAIGGNDRERKEKMKDLSLLSKLGKVVVYFLAGVGIVKTVDGGLYLMNQSDDTMFSAGLGVILLAAFFVVAGIVFEVEQYQSNKLNKNK
jgi:Ni/Fe-hydrogenase subunit HybB-like protein